MAKKKALPVKTLGSYTVRAMDEEDDQGKRRWRLEWYPAGEKGQQRTRSIGRHLERDVEHEAHIAIAGLGRGDARVTVVATTWGQLLGAALADWRKESEATGRPTRRTIADYEKVVAGLLFYVQAWPCPEGARALAAQARELRDALLRRPGSDEDVGLAPSTTRLYLAVAAAAWSWGVREEMVAPLPWQAPSLRVERPVRHVPTLDEGVKVLRQLEARFGADAWQVAAYVLHWATSPRIGELAHLELGDWHPDRGIVVYGSHEGAAKTGRREVVVDPGTVAVVEAYLEARRAAGETLAPTDHVWPMTPSSITSGWWARVVYPAMDAAKVSRWAAHTVRFAAADAFAAAGVDEHSASAQLGNSEAVRRAHYRSALEPARRVAVQARSIAPQPTDAVLAFRRPGEP